MKIISIIAIYFHLLYNIQIIFYYVNIFTTLFILSDEISEQINYKSEIHLLIIGQGNINILNGTYMFEPSEVIINEESNNLCKKTCLFNKEINNVTLYFNESVTTCENMFYNSTNLKEIYFSNFDFSNIISTKNMFANCTNLKKIEFGSINTSSLTNMESMFLNCSNLTSIDLSKFNTNKVETFYSIFLNCISLEAINLRNMNTSSSKSMINFFLHCEKLEYIDISSFDTSSVTDMTHMFFHCYSLKIIIFPDVFDISNVENMHAIFSHCFSLIALNLSVFHLNRNVDNGYMFHNCKNLKYIDLSNFPFIEITIYE